MCLPTILTLRFATSSMVPFTFKILNKNVTPIRVKNRFPLNPVMIYLSLSPMIWPIKKAAIMDNTPTLSFLKKPIAIAATRNRIVNTAILIIMSLL